MELAFLLALLLVLCALLAFFLRHIYFTLVLGNVPFLNSQIRQVSPILLQGIEAYIARAERLEWYELGAATGKITRLIAKNCSFKNYTTLEYDWVLVVIGRIRNRLFRLPITALQGDIFARTCPTGCAMYCYLLPSFLKRLSEDGHFEGNIVFSPSFEIPGKNYTARLPVKGMHKWLFVYDFR